MQRSWVVGLIVVGLGWGCASAPPRTGTYHLVLADQAGKPLAVPGPLQAGPPGVSVELEPLTAEGRAAWLASRAGVTPDPFAAAAPREFLAVRVVLAATSGLPVHWESQGTRLWPKDGHPDVAPLDYTRAYEWLRPDRAGTGLDRVMKGLFDGPVQLAPGERREALLVFPAPALRRREVLLEIPFLQVGETTHRLRILLLAVYPLAARERGR